MRLRYAGTCRVCGGALPANTEAVYERANKTVRCVVHAQQQYESPVEMESVDPGIPGSSARREFERRRVEGSRERSAFETSTRNSAA